MKTNSIGIYTNYLLYNGSSILLASPLLTKKKYSYYEISCISLAISSMYYHIYKTPLSYSIDSMNIINMSLSRTFNPYLSFSVALLTYKSWKMKVYIYLTCALLSFYDASFNQKIILFCGHLLSGISFANYSKINNWNIPNSWGWHLGNSLYVYISQNINLKYRLL